MPFDQSAITGVYPPKFRGAQVYVSWQSSAPAGTRYQVYVNARLAWSGRRTSAWVPIPAGPVRIDVGTVGVGEAHLDFSASLPTAPGRRVRIRWQSGKSKGADLAGFKVYGPAAPGGAVDYNRVLADIAAYPAGIDPSGFGLGGFGAGGFGAATGEYSWTSGPLSAGVWTFAVVSYDSAGNAGTAQITTSTVAGPPRAPAHYAGSTDRLRYTLQAFCGGAWGGGGFGQPQAVLTWNPSPT